MHRYSSDNATDVCLVNMPYTGIVRPSAALGLLHAVLERDGLRTATVCADLLFAEKLGLRRYKLIIDTRAPDALGDWTFAHIAFPDFKPDDDLYVARLIERNTLYINCDPQEFREILWQAREAATPFIDEMTERILEKRPMVVGCTSTLVQHVSSLALFRRLKERAPELINMIGGANCETVMGRATHRLFPWVDYVIAGEGDGLITSLVRCIREHGRDVPASALAEGVYAPVHRSAGYPRDLSGGPDGAPRATSQTLDGLPVPNYDDYFRTLNASVELKKNVIPSVPVETSRGCWWGQGRTNGCTFCSLNGCGKRFRSKPGARVIRELDTLYERYGIHRFYACDNSIDMRWFDTLFPELVRAQKPYRLYYELMSNLRKDQVRLMREAGVTWIWCGVESLHSKLLKLINKGCKAYQNVQFVKWCRQYGIFVAWNVMCDFPGEEDEWYGEMAELLPLLTHLQPPRGFVRLRLDRFSHYHDKAKEYGLELRPSELAPYVYPLDEEQMRGFTYFFEDEARTLHPLVSSLFTRPGMRAAAGEMGWWKKAFWSNNLPVLAMSQSDSEIRIRDTRPVAVSSTFTLHGIEREIYLRCDEACRKATLKTFLEKQGYDKDEVEAAVERLLEQKLMVELDGRLLALAVEEPLPELPKKIDYPGGELLAWLT
ncbi:MAG: RiPP maturation radical SAM C-methyltransferase [Acidobacteriota bacterium]